ncbi:IS1096 element passenger TnpR family protein [Burkholderia sp. A9]|uniref:IS1096 element passenger TnpR family protein n=1 Tax=Burkholderia sp. A9 TaxID=1365108 RepID=UPI0009DE00EC
MTFVYKYDFGDAWEDDIVVKKVENSESEPRGCPHIIAGARACLRLRCRTVRPPLCGRDAAPHGLGSRGQTVDSQSRQDLRSTYIGRAGPAT